MRVADKIYMELVDIDMRSRTKTTLDVNSNLAFIEDNTMWIMVYQMGFVFEIFIHAEEE